jgi:hypothetical protein
MIHRLAAFVVVSRVSSLDCVLIATVIAWREKLLSFRLINREVSTTAGR